jgi:hypothetical protein
MAAPVSVPRKVLSMMGHRSKSTTKWRVPLSIIVWKQRFTCTLFWNDPLPSTRSQK